MVVDTLNKVSPEVRAGRTVVIALIALTTHGDDRYTWDAADPAQVKEAMRVFDDYMKKGYTAFLVDADGKPLKPIIPQDWAKTSVRQAEEILFKKPVEATMIAPIRGG
jgi:ABC-type transporter MlaC component